MGENEYVEWASGYPGFESNYIGLTRKEERLIGEDVWDIAFRLQQVDEKAKEALPGYGGQNGTTPELSRQPIIKSVREYGLAIRNDMIRTRLAIERPENNLQRIMMMQYHTPIQRELEVVLDGFNDTVSFFRLKNTNLAVYLAWHAYHRNAFRGIDLDDFGSEAIKKVGDAADNFDFSRGNKFSTYARPSIQKGLSRLLKKVSGKRRTFSIDNNSGDERPYLAASETELDPATRVRMRESLAMLPAEIREAISTLSDIERQVIYARFGLQETEPMTLSQFGQVIGVTKERVRQIQAKALQKLREVMEDHSITFDDLVHVHQLD